MRRSDIYGPKSVRHQNKNYQRRSYTFSQEDLDNDDIISMVDTTPTYKRSRTELEEIQSKAVHRDSMENKTEGGDASMTITF